MIALSVSLLVVVGLASAPTAGANVWNRPGRCLNLNPPDYVVLSGTPDWQVLARQNDVTGYALVGSMIAVWEKTRRFWAPHRPNGRRFPGSPPPAYQIFWAPTSDYPPGGGVHASYCGRPRQTGVIVSSGESPSEVVHIVAHELFHAFQAGAAFPHEIGDNWWIESTAEWASVTFPGLDARADFDQAFLGHPERPLEAFHHRGAHQYGAWRFADYLSRRLGPQEFDRMVVRTFVRDRGRVRALEHELRASGRSLGKLLGDFWGHHLLPRPSGPRPAQRAAGENLRVGAGTTRRSLRAVRHAARILRIYLRPGVRRVRVVIERAPQGGFTKLVVGNERRAIDVSDGRDQDYCVDSGSPRWPGDHQLAFVNGDGSRPLSLRVRIEAGTRRCGEDPHCEVGMTRLSPAALAARHCDRDDDDGGDGFLRPCFAAPDWTPDAPVLSPYATAAVNIAALHDRYAIWYAFAIHPDARHPERGQFPPQVSQRHRDRLLACTGRNLGRISMPDGLTRDERNRVVRLFRCGARANVQPCEADAVIGLLGMLSVLESQERLSVWPVAPDCDPSADPGNPKPCAYDPCHVFWTGPPDPPPCVSVVMSYAAVLRYHRRKGYHLPDRQAGESFRTIRAPRPPL